MEQFRHLPPAPSDADAPLFLFRAGRVVLIGRRDGAHWVLARGWRIGDQYSDVRSWRFATAELFTSQVGRLVRDEDRIVTPREAMESAGSWVSQVQAR